MCFLVGVPTRNLRPQKHTSLCVFKLTDVTVEAPRGDKVKIQEESLVGPDRERAALFASGVDSAQWMRIKQNLRRAAGGGFFRLRDHDKTLIPDNQQQRRKCRHGNDWF